MTFKGKGFFTWRLGSTEGGDPKRIAVEAQRAGLSHVLLKIADGPEVYRGEFRQPTDYVTPTVEALRAKGIQIWGWHYVYGFNPVAEANVAIARIREYGLDLYVIDAEREFKQSGKDQAARTFMKTLRQALPDQPVALCSYRYPSLHADFPWKEFLDRCDYNMPQMYWIGRHDPAAQLRRCVNEFHTRLPQRPIIPAGATFRESGWQPTVAEVVEFMDEAKKLNMPAVTFWEWYDVRSGIMPGVWEAVRDYPWEGETPQQPPFAQRWIDCLNQHDVDQIVKTYIPNAVHFNPTGPIGGTESLRKWYTRFLNETLADATFTLTGASGTGNILYLTWTAKAKTGVVHNGKDTIGLVGERIAYHYTFFSLSSSPDVP